MSLPTIKEFLSLNIVDLDPTDVSVANSASWPTSGDVADYAYKSLGNIWLLSSPITTAALANTIVYKRGESAENAKQEIVLLSLPEESYQNPEGTQNNNPGALDYYMEIVYRLPDKEQDYNRLLQTSLKVRYLLDTRWRAKRREKPNYITVTPTIDKSLNAGLRCVWLGYTSCPNGSVFAEKWLVNQEIVVPL